MEWDWARGRTWKKPPHLVAVGKLYVNNLERSTNVRRFGST